MKKLVVFLMVFVLLITAGAAFDESGNFLGVRSMLKGGLDFVMFIPDKAEDIVMKWSGLNFSVRPKIDTSISCDLHLFYEGDDTVYIMYLQYEGYVNGVTSWFDFFGNALFGAAGLYDECDVWTYRIVANTYESKWVGESIKLRAGSLNIAPSFEKLYESQLFPDGKIYTVDTAVELPYDMVNEGTHGGR